MNVPALHAAMVACVWMVLDGSPASVPTASLIPCVVPTSMSVPAVLVSMGQHVWMTLLGTSASVQQVKSTGFETNCLINCLDDIH